MRNLTVTGFQTCALPISNTVTMTSTDTNATMPAGAALASGTQTLDRKRVGEGKRVDLGGRPIIKKKKEKTNAAVTVDGGTVAKVETLGAGGTAAGRAWER